MNEWLQNLLRAPLGSGDAPLSGPALWAGMVCLAWAGGITAWCAVRLRKRLAEKRSFVRRALEAGFDRLEAQVLWVLGRHAANGRREAILESAEVFDLCVREAGQAAGDDPVLWPEYLSGSSTAALRRKFSRPRAERARHHIAGTREMEVNQLVNVRLGDSPAFKSFTLSVSEQGLALSLPEDMRIPASRSAGGAAQPGAAGQRVFLSFWRAHDARYECAARATIEALPEGRRLTVAHAPLNRVQEREHVRVRCRQEVRLGVSGPAERTNAAEPGSAVAPLFPFVAMLRDISNGGASFVTDRQIAPGSRVLLRLKLARKPGALTLSARMLRQGLLERTSNPLWASSVQFEALSGRAEHQLSRFIADLQQRLISRLLSRVGAEEETALAFGSEAQARREAGASAAVSRSPTDEREPAGRVGQDSQSDLKAVPRTRSYSSRGVISKAAPGKFAAAQRATGS